MIGNWIKMNKDLPQSKEVMRMARSLNVTKACVIGSLFMFWSWVDTRSEDGSGIDLFDCEIDEIVMLDGFTKAMMDVGWLAGSDGDYNARCEAGCIYGVYGNISIKYGCLMKHKSKTRKGLR